MEFRILDLFIISFFTSFSVISPRIISVLGKFFLYVFSAGSLKSVANTDLNPSSIENVKAMLTAANGYFIDKIKTEINKLGYKMTYGVLTASDFGVPQKRQRAIIIACKNKKNLWL